MKSKRILVGVGLFVLALVAAVFVSTRRLQPMGSGQNGGLESGSNTAENTVSKVSDPADWGEFSSLLTRKVLSGDDRQRLETQIAQLTPNEAWANQMLIDKLNEKTALAYSLKPLLVRGLGNLGSSARSAIPTILDSVIYLTSIQKDMLTPAAVALKQIDPMAEQVIPELAAFEARQEGSLNARYVSQEILKTYDTPLAKEALKRYMSKEEQ